MRSGQLKIVYIKSLVFVTAMGDLFLFLGSYTLIMRVYDWTQGYNPVIYNHLWLYIPLGGLIIFALMLTFDMYRNIFYRQISDIVLSILLIVVTNTMIGLIIVGFFDLFKLPLWIIVMAGIFQGVTIPLWRIFTWYARKSLHNKQSIMIIGDMDQAKSYAMKILEEQGHLFNIRYIYNYENGIENAFELMGTVDHVLLCSGVGNRHSEEIFIYCMKNNKNVFVIPNIFSILLNRANFIQVEDVPIFNLNRFGLTMEQKFAKRIFDMALSTVGLILALPIIVGVAFVVKLTDGGPIFFKQERLTIDNKTFNVYKFRTMVINAEEVSGPVFATARDPRITPIGHFLRATRFDELPQLINVLNGSMSIVGPRPEREYFVNQFIKTTPSFEYRTAVKAGVTGLAQVLGKYTTSFEDKLRYDLMYIKNYSFLLDIKIIIKTLKVVLTKEASSGLGDEVDFDAYLKKKALYRVLTSYGYVITSVNASVVENEASTNEAVG